MILVTIIIIIRQNITIIFITNWKTHIDKLKERQGSRWRDREMGRFLHASSLMVANAESHLPGGAWMISGCWTQTHRSACMKWQKHTANEIPRAMFLRALKDSWCEWGCRRKGHKGHDGPGWWSGEESRVAEELWRKGVTPATPRFLPD